MAKYVVRASAIFIENPGGKRARRCEIGEIVELDAATAKHFVKVGRLDPFVADGEDDEPTTATPGEPAAGEAPAEGAKPRRFRAN